MVLHLVFLNIIESLHTHHSGYYWFVFFSTADGA